MQAKPKPEQCIKGLCQTIEEYCNSVGCQNRRHLDDVEGMLMIFFQANHKARIHLIGQASQADVVESCMAAVKEMGIVIEGEQPKYAW
jgi:extradiol dioxygenase family protein